MSSSLQMVLFHDHPSINELFGLCLPSQNALGSAILQKRLFDYVCFPLKLAILKGSRH